MEAIGWCLACALLAFTFSKNVLATSTANLEFPREETYELLADSKLNEPVRKLSPVKSDVQASRSDTLGDDRAAGVTEASRTFGHKRLQLMLLPMMYKMGVMTTLLMVVTAISAKGLLVGLILLMFKFSTFLSKFHFGWHPHGTSHSWSPPHPIHVHVHNSFPYAHAQDYGGWESASGPGNEDHYYYKG